MTDPPHLAEIRRALAEDRAQEDVTTALLGERAARPATGRFVTEERCVIAGLGVVECVFRELHAGTAFEAHVAEGEWLAPGTRVAAVHGPAAILLGGERVALNLLQRLSGVATMTRRAVDAVRGTGAAITDTRKTTPGLRALEKYAVRVGGGVNHRQSLADAVLWKDNHWVLLDTESLSQYLARAPRGMELTVEVETEAQLEAALRAGVKRILIDNQPPHQVAQWVGRAGAGVAVEASGGITAETARAYAEAGAKYISIGALTHSVKAVGIRLELDLSAATG